VCAEVGPSVIAPHPHGSRRWYALFWLSRCCRAIRYGLANLLSPRPGDSR